MHNIYFIISAIILLYSGLQAPLWLLVRSLKHLPDHDKERTDFIVQKMLESSKNAPVQRRLCSVCKKIAHRYEFTAEGDVICGDCKYNRAHKKK